MMENKTALQFVIDFINKKNVFKLSNQILVKNFDDLLTEVSLLEKQQLLDAYNQGYRDGENAEETTRSLADIAEFTDAENYYNNTFLNNKTNNG